MTIENLTRSIPPPVAPTYRFRGQWADIEKRIGVPLPPDYKELVRLYGSGQFMNFFTVYVPTAPSPPGPFEHAIQAARHLFIYDMQGSLLRDDDPPLPIWPRKGGMLPCGETAWGDYLLWLTRGEVSEWPVVLWDRRQKTVATYEGDLTDFLAGVWGDRSVRTAFRPAAAGIGACRRLHQHPTPIPASLAARSERPLAMRDPHHDDEDTGGFDVDDWMRLAPFTGKVATLDDVQAGRAVFALGDTAEPRVIEMDLPQPLIWWDDDGEQAAVAVQAEAHVNADGEVMEVLGLILPDGGSAVALLEDVDLVDDTDPTWRDLVEAAVGDEG